MGKLTIDGVDYYAAQNGKNKVVIMPYGWIFVGEDITSDGDANITLQNASVVRKWTNGKGIGALASKEYKGDYTLDKCYGNLILPKSSVIAAIECEW